MINFYPVMATDFRLVRGMQNDFLFQLRDIDRKPVPVASDQTVSISIRDRDTLLMIRPLTVMNPAKGVYQLVIHPSEMEAWPSGTLQWSMVTNRGPGHVMLWTDRNYTPTGTIQLTHGPFPGPAPTLIIEPEDFAADAGWFVSPALPGAVQDGYHDDVHTIFADLAGFTGTLRIETADQAQTDWTVVEERNYPAPTLQDVFNLGGDYVWLRVVVDAIGPLHRVLYKR